MEKLKHMLPKGLSRTVRLVWDFVMHLFEVDFIGMAAQTAFFWLLGFFPLILFASTALSKLSIQPDWTQGLIPDEIVELLIDAKMPDFSSPWLFVVSLWAASAGIWALMQGVNAVYSQKRLSSIFARLLALLYTAGFVGTLALTLTVFVSGRWMGVLGSAIAIFALICALFYFTPGTKARFKRCAWTAGLAAALWMLVNWGFEIYLRSFAKYTVIYGSIGAFLGLALWLFIISIVILVCAQLSGYTVKDHAKTSAQKKDPEQTAGQRKKVQRRRPGASKRG